MPGPPAVPPLLPELPEPEPLTTELVSCPPPDYRLAALSLAVEFYAGRHCDEGPVLRAADQFYARLTGWAPGIGAGDAAEIRATLATITTQLEAVMAAQDDINAAIATDTTLLTDLTVQVAAVTAAQAAFAAEITTLQGQGVDTAGLVTINAQLAAAQAPLDAAVTALTAAAAPAAAPPSTSN
jgi:hypothetical protein